MSQNQNMRYYTELITWFLMAWRWGHCYRRDLRGIQSIKICENYLDSDSNKPTGQKQFWDNFKKLNEWILNNIEKLLLE